MKILFLGNSTSWHVVPWVNYFASKHETSLFSFIEPHKHSKDLNNVFLMESFGVIGLLLKVFKIKNDFFYKLNRIISIPIAYIRISILIKKNKIDVIHAHSVFYGFLASFLTSGVPIIFTPMGSDVLVNPKRSKFYKFMTISAYKKAKMVTGDSYILQRTGKLYGATEVMNHVIQNGVDQNIFFPKIKDPDLKKQYNLSEDELLFYSPRQVEELYNIDIIIESLNVLKSNGNKFKCMFSYGPDSKYINSINSKIQKYNLEKNIIWLPLLNHKEMANHYNLCDLVISIPSSDSSPRSVYEAALCKKPIIVSDLSWSHEFFSNTDSLVKIAVRDSDALLKILIDFLTNRSKYELFANKSNKIALEHFDFHTNMNKMESLLQELLLTND
jgi:glycosyltransferase involved in cell wall biosynthesis|tara:strand:+ start:24300 stop:25457 length:1158 start_codon:yes stop_codon:yes gene_type:complete